MQDPNIFGCKIFSEATILGLNLTLHTNTPVYKYGKSPLGSLFHLLWTNIRLLLTCSLSMWLSVSVLTPDLLVIPLQECLTQSIIMQIIATMDLPMAAQNCPAMPEPDINHLWDLRQW